MSYTAQKGQALLIILLVMAVILTVALSVVSRSVTDITISQKEESAARAYSAAEAGIERSLLSGSGVTDSIGADGQFISTVTGLANNSREYIVPLLMSSGETTPVWFVGHNAQTQIECSASFPCFTGNSLSVCWGEEGTQSSTPTTPALEVSILYITTNDFSTARIARAVFDPYDARPDNNGFTKGSEGACIIGNKNFAFSKSLDFASLGITVRNSAIELRGPQTTRLKLLYNTDRAHSVGMTITSQKGTFPQQGNKVESTGTSGDSSRKIEVYQLYPDLPPVFDYGIFAGTGGITK